MFIELWNPIKIACEIEKKSESSVLILVPVELILVDWKLSEHT